MTDTTTSPAVAASSTPAASAPHVVVIGAGPAGLRAAEVLQAQGAAVSVYDAMPSAGRKFLLAGIGGLNLTHSDPADKFAARYAGRTAEVGQWLGQLDAQGVRDWAQGLGIETFVGSSGRVFPKDLKAAPLLRAWLHRLRSADDGRAAGPAVRFHTRHRWLGWTDEGALRFDHQGQAVTVQADAVVLALGGASWQRLGSDGAWVGPLSERGVAVAPLQPSNCGFDVAPTRSALAEAAPAPAPASASAPVGWSRHLQDKFAGAPIKPVALALTGPAGEPVERQQGEFVLTMTGVEGSLVYAFSARLRERLATGGDATLLIDLLPQHTPDQVLAECRRPRGPRSLSTHLKSRLGLAGAKMALVHELLSPEERDDPVRLARALKALPLRVVAMRPIDEAISTAGGVRFDALDGRGMLRALPGVFCAGEMVDWDAPTGGYLMTACLASGQVAGDGVMAWWRESRQG